MAWDSRFRSSQGIVYSRFADYRPDYCRWTGNSLTHYRYARNSPTTVAQVSPVVVAQQKPKLARRVCTHLTTRFRKSDCQGFPLPLKVTCVDCPEKVFTWDPCPKDAEGDPPARSYKLYTCDAANLIKPQAQCCKGGDVNNEFFKECMTKLNTGDDRNTWCCRFDLRDRV